MPSSPLPAKPGDTSTPLDALWQARVIIWVVLAGEGLALVLSLAPGVLGDRWIYFALTSMVIQWVSLLTLAALYLLRQPLRRLRPQHVAYVALALLLLSTWLVTGAAWLLLRGIWTLSTETWQTHLLRFTGIALTVGLLALAAFQNHWRTRQLAVMAKQAELESLQARIQPHFLFNTLNTGAALVHDRPADAEQLLLDLADLFRAALGGPREIPLQEELALTRRYLEIEALRFGRRLQVQWHLPDVLPQARIPALSIQPLAENAIKHGVEPTPEGGVLEISLACVMGMAQIVVRNALPPQGASAHGGHNVGLKAVSARIHAFTDGRGRLETSTRDGHFTATLLLPLDAPG